MSRKRLKVLIIAPPNFKVTDFNISNTGSIEQITYLLSEALAKRGHDITLFATKDAKFPKNVHKGYFFKSVPKNYYDLNTCQVLARDFVQVSSALENADKYDYISCHSMAGVVVMELLKARGIPIVGSTTVHWPTTDNRICSVVNNFKHHPLIVISKHFKERLGDKNNILGIIHNGLKLDQWPYSSTKKEYLLFVGKIIPEKGVDLVIKSALKMNLNLIIAGRIINERNPGFFDKKVKPYLSDKIKYVGEVSGESKLELFKEAKAFIGPGRWEEPCATVFIEAQACGTPVIAWNPGSSNDYIIDGKTGYIISAQNDDKAVEQICKYVGMIDKIKSIDCRNNVRENYTIDKAAKLYEDIMYKQISGKLV